DALDQVLGGEGLDQVVTGPGLHGPAEVLGVSLHGDYDDLRPALLADGLGGRDPVQLRQVDVHQHHVGAEIAGQPDRFDPVARLADHQQVVLGGHQFLQALANLRRVIDDQDGHRAAAGHRITSSVVLRWRGVASPSSTAGRSTRRTVVKVSRVVSLTACSGCTASVTWLYSEGSPASPAGTSVRGPTASSSRFCISRRDTPRRSVSPAGSVNDTMMSTRSPACRKPPTPLISLTGMLMGR